MRTGVGGKRTDKPKPRQKAATKAVQRMQSATRVLSGLRRGGSPEDGQLIVFGPAELRLRRPPAGMAGRFRSWVRRL
jgi:hypothetical protein